MTSASLVLAVPASLGAAGSFAVANVTQMRAARTQATTGLFDPGLLVRLANEPLWLVGLGASVIGFALESAALAVAPVVLVQPMIVAELLFALPLAASSGGTRLGRREWTGAALVAFGLVFFLLIIRPSDSPASASWRSWMIIGCVIAPIAIALLFAAEHSAGIRRTSAFAAAAGVSLGMLSVLTKATMHEFGAHGFGAFATPAPWSVALVGLLGLQLQQSAYRSGPLAVSLPLIDVGEPLGASAIAVITFGEQLGHLDVALSTALACAGAVVASGVALLDRSPLVQAAQAGLSIENAGLAIDNTVVEAAVYVEFELDAPPRAPGGVEGPSLSESACHREGGAAAPPRTGSPARVRGRPWHGRRLRVEDDRAISSGPVAKGAPR